MTNKTLTSDEYLREIVKKQTLADDSDEVKTLRAERDAVEKVLCASLDGSPTIRYGGSHAKSTMVRDSYDLDILCYFDRDDDDSGGTLEELHASVKKALETTYVVEEKASALRLSSKQNARLSIDVLPGRFIDDEASDVFLHRTTGDKARLKTNPDTHIEHVRESGVREAIRLCKHWRHRQGVSVKSFVLELLVIDLLSSRKDSSLDVQTRKVLEAFRDERDTLTVTDPANTNNDLSELFTDATRDELAAAAKATLEVVDKSGWEAVFGKLPDEANKAARITDAVKHDPTPVRPWATRG